jgi:hypothetical protein
MRSLHEEMGCKFCTGCGKVATHVLFVEPSSEVLAEVIALMPTRTIVGLEDVEELQLAGSLCQHYCCAVQLLAIARVLI